VGLKTVWFKMTLLAQHRANSIRTFVSPTASYTRSQQNSSCKTFLTEVRLGNAERWDGPKQRQ
jgi:hypothetical protein